MKRYGSFATRHFDFSEEPKFREDPNGEWCEYKEAALAVAAEREKWQTDHCDCIKTEGGIRGFGAWCHAHKQLLDEYEFHKARDEDLFDRYQSLMDQYMALKGEHEKLVKATECQCMCPLDTSPGEHHSRTCPRHWFVKESQTQCPHCLVFSKNGVIEHHEDCYALVVKPAGEGVKP